MDPVALTGSDWSGIGETLTNAWIMLGFVVLAAANVLVGHIFIPSLTASRHIPTSFEVLRPLFYGGALLMFAGAAYELSQAVELLDVIRRFWNDPWI